MSALFTRVIKPLWPGGQFDILAVGVPYEHVRPRILVDARGLAVVLLQDCPEHCCGLPGHVEADEGNGRTVVGDAIDVSITECFRRIWGDAQTRANDDPGRSIAGYLGNDNLVAGNAMVSLP